jgi:hypothetical protein
MANKDRRGDTLRTHPVYRKNDIDQIVILAAGTTEVTTDISLSAIIGTVVVIVNDTTNSVTATLEIRDEDGAILYSNAATPDDATTVLSNINILVDGTVTIGITPSGAPGASTLTADIRLYVV